jgi:methylenetetrahydrofolate reductase (NADPH)
MSAFGYSTDKKITEVLKSQGFTISAEIVPPRNGEDQKVTVDKLQRIIESGVHFLSVTKGAGGSLRGGSLPMAQAIKDRFSRPCIAHFTCRDLIPAEVENQLMDHHYFGIRNILALRGDPPMGTEEWKPREGGYSYAHELIKHIVRMNQGDFLKRDGFAVNALEKTDFCIGAAVYPEHPDDKERVEFSRLKFSEGAEFGITQMLFNPDRYERCLEELAKVGVTAPILPGLRILKSKKQGATMAQRFQCHVPDWYMKALPEGDGPINEEQILEPFYQLVERLKKIGAPGVHLFILSDTKINVLAVKELIQKGSL